MSRVYVTRGTTIRITEALVARSGDHLAAQGSPDELVCRDIELKGFVLRLRASGRHAFAVAYGRGKLMTLGGTDRLTAGKARKLAREALAEASLDGAPQRVARRSEAITLKEFLDQHYEPWAIEHLRTGVETMARLRVNFKSFLDHRLSDVSQFTVERWRTGRLKLGRQRSTVNRDVVTLKAAMGRAVAWGHLKAHPILGVKPYRVDGHGVIRFLSDDEEARLLAVLDARDSDRRTRRRAANKWRLARRYEPLPEILKYADHLTPIVVLALHTGMRRGELFGLRWRDVDLARSILTVRGSGAKSGKTRHLPLNKIAEGAIAAWRDERSHEADALVFPGPNGDRLEDIKTAWAAIVTAAALREFRFHDLRHTFASKLVQAGVDLNTVRELLGHGDIKMTLRYAHLAPATTATAVAKLVRA